MMEQIPTIQFDGALYDQVSWGLRYNCRYFWAGIHSRFKHYYLILAFLLFVIKSLYQMQQTPPILAVSQ